LGQAYHLRPAITVAASLEDGEARMTTHLFPPEQVDATLRTAAADAGALLQTWIGIRMEEVDAQVAEAKAKVDAIPKYDVLAYIVGEQFILIRALETEVAQLRGEVARLTSRRR
jgi:hypothetical protein